MNYVDLLKSIDGHHKTPEIKCEEAITWMSNRENNVTLPQLREFSARIDNYAQRSFPRRSIKQEVAARYKFNLKENWFRKEGNNFTFVELNEELLDFLRPGSDLAWNLQRYFLVLDWLKKPRNNLTFEQFFALFQEGGVLSVQNLIARHNLYIEWLSKEGNNLTEQQLFGLFQEGGILFGCSLDSANNLISSWLKKPQNNFAVERLLALFQEGGVLFGLDPIYLTRIWFSKGNNNNFSSDQLCDIFNNQHNDRRSNVVCLDFANEWLAQPRNNFRARQVINLFAKENVFSHLLVDHKFRLVSKCLEKENDFTAADFVELLTKRPHIPPVAEQIANPGVPLRMVDGVLYKLEQKEKCKLLTDWIKKRPENNFQPYELILLLAGLDYFQRKEVIKTWFEKPQNKQDRVLKDLLNTGMDDKPPLVQIIEQVDNPEFIRNIFIDLIKAQKREGQKDSARAQLNLIKTILQLGFKYLDIKHLVQAIDCDFVPKMFDAIDAKTAEEKKEVAEKKLSAISTWLENTETKFSEVRLFNLFAWPSSYQGATPLQQGSAILSWLRNPQNNFTKEIFTKGLSRFAEDILWNAHYARNGMGCQHKLELDKVDLYKKIDLVAVWLSKDGNNFTKNELEDLFKPHRFLDEAQKLDKDKAAVYEDQRTYITRMWNKKNPEIVTPATAARVKEGVQPLKDKEEDLTKK